MRFNNIEKGIIAGSVISMIVSGTVYVVLEMKERKNAQSKLEVLPWEESEIEDTPKTEEPKEADTYDEAMDKYNGDDTELAVKTDEELTKLADKYREERGSHVDYSSKGKKKKKSKKDSKINLFDTVNKGQKKNIGKGIPTAEYLEDTLTDKSKTKIEHIDASELEYPNDDYAEIYGDIEVSDGDYIQINNTPPYKDLIESISPDDYQYDDKFVKCSLVYAGDSEILYDELGDIIDNIKDTVGDCLVGCIPDEDGMYSEDIIYVRNHKIGIDYEIECVTENDL